MNIFLPTGYSSGLLYIFSIGFYGCWSIPLWDSISSLFTRYLFNYFYRIFLCKFSLIMFYSRNLRNYPDSSLLKLFDISSKDMFALCSCFLRVSIVNCSIISSSSLYFYNASFRLFSCPIIFVCFTNHNRRNLGKVISFLHLPLLFELFASCFIICDFQFNVFTTVYWKITLILYPKTYINNE